MVLVLLICYLKLFILSYKKKRLSNNYLLISIIAKMLHLLYNIFFFPLLDMNLIILFCHKQYNIFDDDIECYKGKYNLYLFLASFNLLVTYYFCYLYLNFFFYYFEDFYSGISKYVIINSEKSFFYMRLIIILFAYINEKTDLKKTNYFVYFFCSLINLYFINKENYYKNKKDIYFNVIYVYSIILFITCTLLLISSLNNLKFKGLIYGFFLFFFLVILIFYFKPKENLDVFSEFFAFNDDLIVYNELRKLIKILNYHNNQREYKFNLYNFSAMKKELSNLKLENDFISNYNKKEDFIFFLNKYIEDKIKQSLNYFPNSKVLVLLYFDFLKTYLKRYKKAYLVILNLYENKRFYHLEKSEEFFVYRYKKHIEEKIFIKNSDRTELSINYNKNVFVNQIIQVSNLFEKFWKYLIGFTSDLNVVFDYGLKINNYVLDIDYRYFQMKKFKFHMREIDMIYGIYLREIMNDYETSKKIFDNMKLQKIDNELTKENFLSIDLDTILTNSNFQYLILSGKEEDFGTILKISLNLCIVLGYKPEELIGNNYKIIVPDFLKDEHDLIIKKNSKKYFNFNQKDKSKLFTGEFFFKNSSKFITPLIMTIDPCLDENYNKIILCRVNYENKLKIVNDSNYRSIILTNAKFLIKAYTSNCLRNIDKNLNLYLNKDIYDLIYKNKFNSTILNSQISSTIFQKKLLFYKNLINTINENENSKTFNINGDEFKIKVDELKFSNKIVAYIFIFQKIINNNKNIIEDNKNKRHKSFLIDVNNSINTKLTKPKIKLYGSSIISNNNKLKSNIKEDNQINYNNSNENLSYINNYFIPFSSEIVDFNYDKNKYIFHKKKVEKYYIDNLGSLVEKKFNENINKESEKESSNERTSLSSNSFSNSSNISSISNETNNNNNQIRKNSILNNQNINNSLDDYYKIKYKNIKLFIYDYSQNSLVEIKKFIVDKVNFIIETIKKPLNIKKYSQKSLNEYKRNINKQISSQFYNQNDINLSSETTLFIKNKIKPKKINVSIIYLLITNILVFIILFLIGAFFFYLVLIKRKETLVLVNVTFYLFDLMENAHDAFYYAFELILSQNPRYTNFNMTREELKNLSQYHLSEFNQETDKLIVYLDNNEIKFSKKNKKKMDEFKINGSFIGINESSDINIDSPFINIIEEYSYSLYSLATEKESELKFSNLDFAFLLYNTDSFFISGLNSYSDIIFDEYRISKKYNKYLLIFYSIFMAIIYCLLSILKFKINIKVILEKEKNMKKFIVLDQNYIVFAIEKCEKFLLIYNNIKIINKNEIINIPKLDIDAENNNISTNYDDEKMYLLKNNIKQIQEINFNKIYDMKSVKVFLAFNLIQFIYIFIIVIILNIYLSNIFNKTLHYIDIYYLTFNLKINNVILFNYLRLYIIFSSGIFQPTISNKVDYLIEKSNEIYEINKNYIDNIYNIIKKYGLPKNSYDKYEQFLDKDACSYFNNFSKAYDIKCEDFADNITTYGVSNVLIYYSQNIQSMLKKVFKYINISEEIGYGNFEIYYGTDIYPLLISLYEDLDDYYAKIPFHLLNDEDLKTLTILNELLKMTNKELIKTLREDIFKIYDRMLTVIIISLFIFFIGINVYFFVFQILDIYKKNELINTTRRMLRLIPKDILYKLILEGK